MRREKEALVQEKERLVGEKSAESEQKEKLRDEVEKLKSASASSENEVIEQMKQELIALNNKIAEYQEKYIYN